MLRITVKFCLFTFLFFAQFSVINATELRGRLAIELEELVYPLESNSIGLNLGARPGLAIEALDASCQFADRLRVEDIIRTQSLKAKESDKSYLAIANEPNDAPPVPRLISETPIESPSDTCVSAVNNCPSEFANAEARYSLEPISTTEIPMFLIEDLVEDNSQPKKLREHKGLSIDLFERISIPVFFIQDTNDVTRSELSGNDEMDIFSDDSNAEIPVSIEAEETRDPYWQYYEDCDRWGVDFAKLLLEGISIADEDTSSVVPASFEVSDSEFESGTLITQLNLLGSTQSIGSWIFSLPPIADVKFQSVKELEWSNSILDEGSFLLTEHAGIDFDMVNVKALSPITQALVISHEVGLLDIHGLVNDAIWHLDLNSLDCVLYEIQADFFEPIEMMVEKVNAHRKTSHNAFRNALANQIHGMAWLLDELADSIRTDGSGSFTADANSTITK